MSESDLLEHIYAANPALAAHIVIPPGDDMGMVRLRAVHRNESGGVEGECDLLAAVDQVVDGRHFDLAVTPLALIGRKAITRNLSDVAAMAARPLATLAAVTLPRGFAPQRANQLFDAMRETAAHYGGPLMGGDIAVHATASTAGGGGGGGPLTCAVTILAEPGPTAPVRRSGARPGDGLYVTGELGGSLEPGGLGRHLTFEPRVDLALALAAQVGGRLHAMIDISDGLGRDAGHIARQSGVAIVIDAARVPCRSGCDWRAALTDGEDYELCFAAAGAVPPQLEGVAITRVGTVSAAKAAAGAEPEVGAWVRDDNGVLLPASEMGWEHRT